MPAEPLPFEAEIHALEVKIEALEARFAGAASTPAAGDTAADTTATGSAG